jgi:hypothetical protein
MWRMTKELRIGLAILLFASVQTISHPFVARAEMAGAPSLIISQLKITSSNGQFVTLYNATDHALDMGKYQLQYFNNYDLTKATSSRMIALAGTLPPHSYYMVNDDSLVLCYQMTVSSVSLGLSSTAGMVQVLGLEQHASGGAVTPVLQDYVGWSRSAASGAVTLPGNTSAFLQRQPIDDQYFPDVALPGVGSWQTVQRDSNNACNLVTIVAGVPVEVPLGPSDLLPSTEAPATILSETGDVITSPTIPVADIGLMSPQITELLPNPTGTGNDATDEYIELYNPNPVEFDLSGFVLQTGTTSLHAHTFATGTKLAPQSFVAFYADKTDLSLSNSGGQVQLLDPLGRSIATTDVYGAAKDGQSWSKANGAWYWTTTITPNTANVIKLPATKQSATKKTTTKGQVKAATTAKKSAGAASASSKNFDEDTAAKTTVHLWTLALVAAVALLYGAYEYRADLANRFLQFKRYLSHRF